MDRDRVVLAELRRPWGRHGELLATSLTDVPGRLEQLSAAWIRLRNGEDCEARLECARPYKKDGWLLRFSGVDSIDKAQLFAGGELWVCLESRGKLGPGEHFQSDLVGCAVIDDQNGRLLGEVVGWQQYGGPPLMEVDHSGRESLIPFVPEICRHVDLEARSVRVCLPDGLLDL